MQTANITLAKRLNIAAWIVSAAVLGLVVLMREVKIDLPAGVDFSFLPPFYSALNALTAVVLLVALYYIRQKKVRQHRNAIFVALTLSVLFLLAYVLYHFTTPSTVYGDLDHNGILETAEAAAVAGSRTFYLVILISHVVLAAVSFPFILFTFVRGYTYQVERHKKMARWVFPVWLYVAITGPICYYMLLPYYP